MEVGDGQNLMGLTRHSLWLRSLVTHLAKSPADIDVLVDEVYTRLFGEPLSEHETLIEQTERVAHAVICDYLAQRDIGCKEEWPLRAGTKNRTQSAGLRGLAAIGEGLPELARRGLTLRKVYECGPDEIAQRLSISDETVAHHLAIAVTHCSRTLADKATPRAIRIGEWLRARRRSGG